MNHQQQDRREMTLKAKLSVPEPAAPPWGILGAALSLIAMFFSMTLIGPGLASLLLGRQEAEPLLLMLGWAIGLVATAAFVLISRRNSDSSWQALRLQKGSLPLPMVLLIGVAIALAIDLFISLAGGQFLPVPPDIWLSIPWPARRLRRCPAPDPAATSGRDPGLPSRYPARAALDTRPLARLDHDLPAFCVVSCFGILRALSKRLRRHLVRTGVPADKLPRL